MSFKLVLAVLPLLVVSTFGQYPINGTCPSFDQCRDNNISYTKESLKGIWYLYASIPYKFQIGFKCTYYNFTEHDEVFWNFDKYERNTKTNELRSTFGLFNTSSVGGEVDVLYTSRKLTEL